MTTGSYAAIVVVYFVVSVVSVATGGGSLVQVPALIALGMMPRAAVATNMFAVTWMTVSATARFARAGQIGGRFVVPLVAITAVTSFVGAGLAVAFPERLVKGVVAASMLAMIVFLAVVVGSIVIAMFWPLVIIMNSDGIGGNTGDAS